MALSEARKTHICHQTIYDNAAVVNALGTSTFGDGMSLPRTDSLAGPNGVTSTFACLANVASGDGAQALARMTHVRGAAQQARHVYGDDKAGRITGWEQQGIGRNTAKTACTHSLKDELVQAEDADLASNTEEGSRIKFGVILSTVLRGRRWGGTKSKDLVSSQKTFGRD